jgi:hypothetical protein
MLVGLGASHLNALEFAIKRTIRRTSSKNKTACNALYMLLINAWSDGGFAEIA